MKASKPASFVASVLVTLFACKSETETQKPTDLPPEAPAAIDPADAVIQRLTATQYRNAIHDLFGEDVVTPPALEPDANEGGLISVGASITTISPLGVEQYENGAFNIAEQVMAAEKRGSFVSCQPQGTMDDACARTFVTEVGRTVWRRPLTNEEVEGLVSIAGTAATTLNDFHQGLQFALAAMLQSPNFLFRIDLGENDPDRPGSRRYTNHELASRLSFFLWNTIPDAELNAAADAGELVTDAGIQKHARRMIDDPRARAGVRNFFTELYALYRLDELSKDPIEFTHFSTELGDAAREETLRVLEDIVFDSDTDYRTAFTTTKTFVDRRLAAIYNIRASTKEGFGEVQLAPEGLRRGILGHASILGLYSHPVASSATLRGAFVRTVLLCGVIPPPPVDVNTSLPEPSGNALTLRDRVDEHLTNPSCAGCHSLMDPIGLGLENFDGIGRLRMRDNGAVIDASGEVDGTAFTTPWDLGEVIANHPAVGRCLVRSMYRYATGNVERGGELDTLAQLTRRFEEQGFRIKPLLFDIATSLGFRLAKEPS